MTDTNSESELRQKVWEALRDDYACTRVWEAWQVGTMTQDDFEPLEDTERPDELVKLFLDWHHQQLEAKTSLKTAKCPTCLGTGKVWRDEHDYKMSKPRNRSCPTCGSKEVTPSLYTQAELEAKVNQKIDAEADTVFSPNTEHSSSESELPKSEDQFYGQLDNIIMWCFTLGFNAARREYGEQYKSAREAEPNYEDNLDSWIQDIITSHEEIVEAKVAEAYKRGYIDALTPAYDMLAEFSKTFRGLKKR